MTLCPKCLWPFRLEWGECPNCGTCTSEATYPFATWPKDHKGRNLSYERAVEKAKSEWFAVCEKCRGVTDVKSYPCPECHQAAVHVHFTPAEPDLNSFRYASYKMTLKCSGCGHSTALGCNVICSHCPEKTDIGGFSIYAKCIPLRPWGPFKAFKQPRICALVTSLVGWGILSAFGTMPYAWAWGLLFVIPGIFIFENIYDNAIKYWFTRPDVEWRRIAEKHLLYDFH